MNERDVYNTSIDQWGTILNILMHNKQKIEIINISLKEKKYEILAFLPSMPFAIYLINNTIAINVWGKEKYNRLQRRDTINKIITAVLYP
jgi:hypothetical protein